ncbi:MAG: repressor LexA [Elusimicrobia bacterium]|nr:repressor LexA [Elusimicrobiota bacterium]
MEDAMTAVQRRVLEFIVESIQQRGFPPTIREIGSGLRIPAPSSVTFHLKALERLGLLRRVGSQSRGLVPVGHPFRLPILGRVGAGPGPLAQEEVEGHLALDKSVGRGAHFSLRVRGDSMVGAGILNGDLALVRRQEEADDGNIVVAIVEDEGVVKRLRRKAGAWRLESANPRYPAITAPFRIVGKVVGIIRHYEP